MRAELVSIPTPTHPLDGAYYTPEGPIKAAAMYCHGNQMNFYVGAEDRVAKIVTEWLSRTLGNGSLDGKNT